MRALRIKRGAALALATAALAATAAVSTAGTAAASSGGGCAGPTWKNVCIADHNNGAIGADAYLDLGNVNPNCYVEFGVFDKTSWAFATRQSVSCRNGYQHLGVELTNPSSGHQYVTFAKIHWSGGSDLETTDSPILTY